MERGVRAFDKTTRERIALLDDDPASLRIMQEVLTSAGYECVCANDPQEALDLIAQAPPFKVLISDICMPGMDGLAFLGKLNQLQLPQMPRVLFLTGHPTLDRAVAALRLGAADFLVKPTRPKELLEAVERATGREPTSPMMTEDGNWTVEGLAKQAESLAKRLRMMTAPANGPGEITSPPTRPPAGAKPASRDSAADETQRQARMAQLLETMEQLPRLRRRNYSGLEDMDDVAWELLMEVLRSNREGRQISVSGLTISVEGVSPTTALRRTNELVAKGHLHRVPDPTDARRDFVTLDPKTRAALEDYLSRAAEHLADPLG